MKFYTSMLHVKGTTSYCLKLRFLQHDLGINHYHLNIAEIYFLSCFSGVEIVNYTR